jgi:hypothetical protein
VGLKEAGMAAIRSGMAAAVTDKALSYAMGTDVKKATLAAAHVQLGTTTLTARYATHVSAMVTAVGKKDAAGYERAKAALRTDMNGYLAISDAAFVDLLGVSLKQGGAGVVGKLKDLAKSKLKELTKATIDPPLKSAKGSVGSIPYVGGLLATVVGFVEDYSIEWLYGYFLDHLEQPLLQLYNQAIDALIPELKNAMKNASPGTRADVRLVFGAIREVKAELDRDREALLARINQNIADLDRLMIAK